MKRTQGLWNLVRITLIVFCGYQLLLSAMASQQAERILRMSQLPSEHHEAVSNTVEAVQAAVNVLHRHTGSTLYYVGFLVILALSPYATARNV